MSPFPSPFIVVDYVNIRALERNEVSGQLNTARYLEPNEYQSQLSASSQRDQTASKNRTIGQLLPLICVSASVVSEDGQRNASAGSDENPVLKHKTIAKIENL